MAEYIKRKDAVKKIIANILYEEPPYTDSALAINRWVADQMADVPSIGIKTGKWQITSAYPHIVYCSECHKRYAQTNWAVWNDKDYPLPRNYCPNCGAKMEGIDG